MDSSKSTYLNFRKENLREENGVLVGSDMNQEWLLRWWWERYKKYNSIPVAFLDFGMSYEMKDWCKSRGELISLKLMDDFVALKEELPSDFVETLEKKFGIHFWKARSAWFKKPFALLKSPFQRTLWLDLDCEIRGSLLPLFLLKGPFAMALDQGDIESTYPLYNSGVILYDRNVELIQDWARECFTKSNHFLGDQEVFSNLVLEKRIPVSEIPPTYNWNYRNPSKRKDVIILHFLGDHGKCMIRKEIRDENLELILKKTHPL